MTACDQRFCTTQTWGTEPLNPENRWTGHVGFNIDYETIYL